VFNNNNNNKINDDDDGDDDDHDDDEEDDDDLKMNLGHVRCLSTGKILLNMQLCLIKLAKCKQSGLPHIILIYYNYTNCQQN
jgi:hypothetical protein